MSCNLGDRKKMTKEEVIASIEKYEQNNATEQERGLLESWYNQYAGQHMAADFPEDLWLRKENSLKVILSQAIQNTRKPARLGSWRMISSAAALILVVLGLTFWLYKYRYQPVIKNTNTQVSGVKENLARSGATLTLSNRRVVQLDGSKAGIIIGGNKLTYDDGSLVLGAEATVQEGGDVNLQNDELIINVPRAVQYHVQLSDGSKIWLNSDSRLKIAGSFKDNLARMVGLIGEAYFEVAKADMKWQGRKRKRPFYVLSKKQSISVLGTCFNISSYPEEPLQTTLLEGVVEVNTRILKPGEQAEVSRRGHVTVKTVALEDVISWRSGYFRFSNEHMESVMNKISRWYDVDVRYDGEDLKKQSFSGTIVRSKHISEVLNTMQKNSGFKFELNGRRLVVKRM